MKYWTDGSRKNVGRICLKEFGISCSAQAQCVDSIQGIYIDIANFKSRHVHQICKSFFSPSRFFPNLFGENLPAPQADVLILETTTDTSTRRCRWRRERDQYSRESLFACHEVSEDVFNFPSIFFTFLKAKSAPELFNLSSSKWEMSLLLWGVVFISHCHFSTFFLIFYALITLNAQDFCRLAFVTSCSASVSPKDQIFSDKNRNTQKMLQYNLNLLVYSLTKVSLETRLDRKDKFTTAWNSAQTFFTRLKHHWSI